MIFLDFDGTLVDLWPRYYSVFKEILKIENLEIDEYKSAKQRYLRDSLVAGHFGKELPADYFLRKAKMLEDPVYLKKDRLLINVDELNSFMAHDVFILTKRRNPDNFKRQMRWLGIVGQSIIIANGCKRKWVEHNIPKECSVTIVGDSTAELEAVRLHNVEAWMVGYGLSSKIEYDSTYLPYQYIESPAELREMLKRRICNKCNLEI